MNGEATLQALVELQLRCLRPSPGPLLDDPRIITAEAFEYVQTVPDAIQKIVHSALDRINAEARLRRGRDFHALSVAEREAVLDQLWGDHLFHELISLVVRLGWLVIYSREPARQHVHFSCPMAPTVDVPEPARPSLDVDYDVCIIGSGAGGSVVAARAVEAGRRVLIVDDGRWVSPRDFPTRDDRALRDLYRDSGIRPALPNPQHILKPGGLTFINVLQARVVGGGPAINNAIHLPISEGRLQEWRDRHDCPVTWPQLKPQLDRVAQDIGANTEQSQSARGGRTTTFYDAALQLGLQPQDLPVSVHTCIGCGGCNSGCRFGRKTGGLHGPREAGAPRSYLDRALAGGALIAPRVEARAFDGGFLGFGRRVRALIARDLATGREVRIRAKRYVLAAGPIASSELLRRSRFQITSPVGRHLAANVVLPVYAILPQDVGSGAPDPGLQMCIFVDQGGRLLETWFHYPGSLAAALPEWLTKHVAIMERYRRLAVCGVVVPTDRRGEIGPTGNLVLSLSDAEVTQMVNGVISVAEVFTAAGAERVIPSTARPVYLRKDHLDEDKKAFRQSIRGPADFNLATAHPQGGNAVGRRKTASVVSERFSLFDFTNLFVADASLFPAGCGVNPQMTTMALAHLAAERVVAD